MVLMTLDPLENEKEDEKAVEMVDAPIQSSVKYMIKQSSKWKRFRI